MDSTEITKKDGKNTLGLDKQQMNEQYHDKIDVLNSPVNAHIHWFNKRGYCNICSDKAKEVELE